MKPHRKIKSFVCRNSRMTVAQRDAFKRLAAEFVMPAERFLREVASSDINKNIQLSCQHAFSWHPVTFKKDSGCHLSQKALGWHDNSFCILEIGFGNGKSLLTSAKENPEKNFIGIETHQPGVASVLMGIEKHQIKNIKIFYADAVDVLQKNIPDHSFNVIQIFFPDPWPKRRHNKRRLIQPEFVHLLTQKLKQDGVLHLATDWEDYAMHMMTVLSNNESLINQAGKNQFAERSLQRPIVTKFEQRGLRAGRKIWELQFALSFTKLSGEKY